MSQMSYLIENQTRLISDESGDDGDRRATSNESESQISQ